MCMMRVLHSVLLLLGLLFAPAVASFTHAPRLSTRPTFHRAAVVRCADETPADEPAAEEEQLDAADISSLYASLRQRAAELSSKREVAQRERDLLASLGEVWPTHEIAKNSLWTHWFTEEGEAAGTHEP